MFVLGHVFVLRAVLSERLVFASFCLRKGTVAIRGSSGIYPAASSDCLPVTAALVQGLSQQQRDCHSSNKGFQKMGKKIV